LAIANSFTYENHMIMIPCYDKISCVYELLYSDKQFHGKNLSELHQVHVHLLVTVFYLEDRYFLQ